MTDQAIIGRRRKAGPAPWPGFAALLGALALAGLAQPASAADGGSARCAALAEAVLPHAKILQATYVPAGAFQPPAGPKLAGLPAFCRLSGLSTPTPRSHIGFEVWMPAAGWTGRIHMIGNGGYSSDIRWNLLGDLLRAGSVSVATDTGHTGDDLDFGFDNTDAIEDWGHRAVHESIVDGKLLVQRYYGRAPRYAYFSGCSTGGHQALMEAQRYPADFDGVIAGDPGNNRTNLNFGFLWQFLRNHAPGDNLHPLLDAAALKIVSRAALAQCDGLDGRIDGVIEDPRRCHFDPEVTRCKPGLASDCLTPAQVAAVRAMYAGARKPNGEQVYSPWPVGSEYATGQGSTMGWNFYWANPAHPDEPQRVDFFRRWALHDPAWNWWTLDWDKDVDRIRAVMQPMVDATDPDLSAFKARGGKLVIFTGWADPVVSAYDVIGYYQAVAERSGGLAKAQAFTRLYLAPGMEHCAGGPGATNFVSSTRDSQPLKPDSQHDLTLALQDWVEKGRAPRAIIAANYHVGEGKTGLTLEGGHLTLVPTATAPAAPRPVEFTRKLCPYPAAAAYRGAGDPAVAENYACHAGPP